MLRWCGTFPYRLRRSLNPLFVANRDRSSATGRPTRGLSCTPSSLVARYTPASRLRLLLESYSVDKFEVVRRIGGRGTSGTNDSTTHAGSAREHRTPPPEGPVRLGSLPPAHLWGPPVPRRRKRWPPPGNQWVASASPASAEHPTLGYHPLPLRMRPSGGHLRILMY